MNSTRLSLLLLSIFTVLLSGPLVVALISPALSIARADDSSKKELATHIKAAYTKYEYEIPMRDETCHLGLCSSPFVATPPSPVPPTNTLP